VVNEHIKKMITEIIDSILTRKVDIFSLCDKLCYSPDEFLNLLSNPVSNLSVYMEMLEVIHCERD